MSSKVARGVAARVRRWLEGVFGKAPDKPPHGAGA